MSDLIYSFPLLILIATSSKYLVTADLSSITNNLNTSSYFFPSTLNTLSLLLSYSIKLLLNKQYLAKET